MVPAAEGLSKDEVYLPALVQGVFVGDFSKFSGFKVLDRQSLDKVLAETESGVYSEKANFAQLGEITGTQYIMTGKLVKTKTGFSLQMQITDTKTAAADAAYSGVCTFAELENNTGIKKASQDLLTQMGVSLTDKGKQELSGINEQAVKAETALAKGITAQKSDTVVEALAYYYQAASFDPSLAEAASRLSTFTAEVKSGNIGANVRNDIQRRKEWVKVLDDAEKYFKEHMVYDLVYDPTLKQGKVDYQKETVDLTFNMRTAANGGIKILEDIKAGLAAANPDNSWGLYLWPFAAYGNNVFDVSRGITSSITPKVIVVTIGLLNENNNQVGTCSANIYYNRKDVGGIESNKLYFQYRMMTIVHRPNITDDQINIFYYDEGYEWMNYKIGWFKFNNNIYFNTIDGCYGTDMSTFKIETNRKDIAFENVDANDITDKLTIKFLTINGRDAEEAGKAGYLKISTEQQVREEQARAAALEEQQKAIAQAEEAELSAAGQDNNSVKKNSKQNGTRKIIVIVLIIAGGIGGGVWFMSSARKKNR